jgi:response regulator RpfG family c-di-GMP phosphodiesterase
MNDLSILIVSNNEERQSLFSHYIAEFAPNSNQISAFSIDDAENAALGNLPVIIFCDEFVNSKSCLELYQKLKSFQLQSLIYFIVVTDKTNHYELKTFINNGFDDYLIGDKNKSIILNRFRIAKRNIDLKLEILRENKELKLLKSKLEKEIDGIKKLSVKLIESKIPSARNMLTKISDISLWIARHVKDFSDEELFDIEIASYYSQVGRLFISNELAILPVMSNGRVLHQEMSKVPASAKDILGSMEIFSNAAKIAYHIWENFDGSGIPKRLQKWQIPIESRIIRVAIDYEENRYFRNFSAQKAIDILKSRINRLYDPKVVSLIEQYKGMSDDSELNNEINVRVDELQAEMILTRDLNTSGGLKMLGKGTKLNNKNIQIIQSHSSNDPILGYVYVDKSFLQNKLDID